LRLGSGSGSDGAPLPSVAEPSPANDYHAEWVSVLDSSLRELTGRNLLDRPSGEALDAAAVYAEDDIVVLSHALIPAPDPDVGPMFNYGNAAGRNLFEVDWPTLVGLPSRRSAELGERAERERLLNTVEAQGYIDDYRGIRISSTGRRFWIQQAVVWNVIDDSGRVLGQAATFKASEVERIVEGREEEEGETEAARRVRENFQLMCYSFSANHGCATAALSLASTRFGVGLGGLSSGVLYIFYVLSALTLAGPAVNRLGSRNALAASLGLYCAYVAEFAASSTVSAGNEAALLLLGSALGGLAAGTLWVAEGAYYGAAAEQYRSAAGLAVGAGAENRLRGIFARSFLGGEVLIKLLTSGLIAVAGDSVAFLALFGLSLASAAAAWAIEPIEPSGAAGAQQGVGLGELAGALTLDWRSYILLPWNVAFGLGVAFLQLNVNAALAASSAFGPAAVGVAGTIAITTAATASEPMASSEVFWQPLAAGVLGYLALGLGFGFGEPQDSGLWVAVAPVFVAWGLSRSAWEGPFKAFFAELYGGDVSRAFPVTIVQSGLASAVGFLGFPYLSMQTSGGIVAALGALGLSTLLYAKELDIDAKA